MNLLTLDGKGGAQKSHVVFIADSRAQFPDIQIENAYITGISHAPVDPFRVGRHQLAMATKDFAITANHYQGVVNRQAPRPVGQLIAAYHTVDLRPVRSFRHALSLLTIPSDGCAYHLSRQFGRLPHRHRPTPKRITAKVDFWENKEVQTELSPLLNVVASLFQSLLLVEELW